MAPELEIVQSNRGGELIRFSDAVHELAKRGPVVVSFDRDTNTIRALVQPEDDADGDETDAFLGIPGARRRIE